MAFFETAARWPTSRPVGDPADAPQIRALKRDGPDDILLFQPLEYLIGQAQKAAQHALVVLAEIRRDRVSYERCQGGR